MRGLDGTRVPSNAVAPEILIVFGGPLSAEVHAILLHDGFLPRCIEERPQRAAPEMVRDRAVHADGRMPRGDQPVAVVHVGTEQRHVLIDVSDLLDALLGNPETEAAEAVGLVGVLKTGDRFEASVLEIVIAAR